MSYTVEECIAIIFAVPEHVVVSGTDYHFGEDVWTHESMLAAIAEGEERG